MEIVQLNITSLYTKISVYKRGMFQECDIFKYTTCNSSKTKLTCIKERILGGQIFGPGASIPMYVRSSKMKSNAKGAFYIVNFLLRT